MTRLPVWVSVFAFGFGIATQVVAQQAQGNYREQMMQGHTMQGPMMQGPMMQGPMMQGPMMRGPTTQRQTVQTENAAAGAYQRSCASCHGTDGRGDGPAAMALNPKPQDFRDCKRMSAYSDQTLFDAVKGGGQAVGLSPMMPAWGGSLSDEQIHGLVQYVRSFCQ